jgi:hypothetical protein
MIDPRIQMRSRRKLLSLGCAGGMMNLLGMSGIAQTSESESSPVLIPEVKSVVRFGARGDGSTDDTAAFQRALDSVGCIETRCSDRVERGFVLKRAAGCS